MNKEIYVAQTNEIKEVLTNMPQNNKGNKQKYISYIKEQLTKYNQMKNTLVEEIKVRNINLIEKEKKYIIDYTKSKEEKEKLFNQLMILNERNTPYEKIGLDRIIFNINRYYEGNLEVLNEEIAKAINCFKEVGVNLTSNDFWYSRYLNQYMKLLLNNAQSDEVKQKLNEIYWKAPNIINQVAMNFNNLYFKYEKYFNEYYKNKIEEILSINSKEKLLVNYNGLVDSIGREDYSIYTISKRFISGEDSVKDFSLDKCNSYLDTFGISDFNNENLIKLNDTLYEYSMYQKYKFLIDSFITIYKEKDKNKNVYKNLRKEIGKDESKIKKINKKIEFQEKWSKNRDKIEMLEIDLNTLMASLKDKYTDLQIQKINELISGLTNSLSYYDILKIISSNYIYLRKELTSNNEGITDNEINDIQLELSRFLLSNRLTILDNVKVLDEGSIPNTISNMYRLLNIKIEESEIESNTDNYIELLRKIRIIKEINSSDITYDELLFQVDSQGIING